MKITDITYGIYAWPNVRAGTSGRGRGTTKHRMIHHTFVYIHTDDGITGIGVGRSIDNIELLKPVLIGQDPLCHELLMNKMYNGVLKGYKYVETISAVDIALWDLKAKVAGMPLYKLLGGMREKVECYVAGGYYAPGKTTAMLQAEMEEYLSWGVKAVKMKVGGLSPSEDAARVKAVRDVIGPDNKLLLDAGGAWKYNEAIEFARRVEDCYPYFLEEPCPATDLEGFKRVYEHTTIPLAAGESAAWKYGARDLIDTGSVAFIQPDATLCGGVTDVMKIASYADTHHIWVAPHGIQQLHVHLDCAAPNAAIAEFYPSQFGQQNYYLNPVKIDSDGTVAPPEAPGASLEVDLDFLAQYRIG